MNDTQISPEELIIVKVLITKGIRESFKDHGINKTNRVLKKVGTNSDEYDRLFDQDNNKQRHEDS